MNQSEAESVKDLAKPVVEVMGVITERKCNLCEGSGLRRARIDSTAKARCEDCNATGKVKWKWKPSRGESVLRQPLGDVDLITRILPHGMLRLSPEDDCLFFDKHASGFIPILHWEEIERVLEGKYNLLINKLRKDRIDCEIQPRNSFDVLAIGTGKSRQEAVMRAVIKLGKELT